MTEPERRIPMSAPDITEDEVAAVMAVLRTGQLSLGPQVAEFEQRVADYTGARHAVAVSSGTAGLHLCVLAAGVHDGDLVITTPFSFVASANVLLYERAIPIFVDIDPVSLNMDPDLAAQAARDIAAGGDGMARWLPRSVDGSRSHRLSALLPVDVFGQPAEMDALRAVANEHALAVIEDAAEAIGARYHGRAAGTLGDAGVFAFYPNKQMTTGEGGVIVTDDDDWAGVCRSLRNQGRDVFDGWLGHSRLGYNYRLDEMSAAMGAVQTLRLDDMLARRAQVAAWYADQLAGMDDVAAPVVVSSTSTMSWFVYVARLAADVDRDAVIVALTERGVPARPYFPPIHLMPFYRERFGYEPGDFPIAEAAARSTIALPFHTSMAQDEVGYVCSQLSAVLASGAVRFSGS